MRESKPAGTSRRAFITRGGAALGAGLASASVAAAGLYDPSLPLQARLDQLQKQLSVLEDSEALRHLHLTYTTLVENRAFDAVVELFADDASVAFYGESFNGKYQGIRTYYQRQLADEDAAVIHATYVLDQSHQQDGLSISDDGQRATATFHARVKTCRPLRDQSVASAMAKMQGMSSSTVWENGRFNVDYARTGAQWRIVRLHYQTV